MENLQAVLQNLPPWVKWVVGGLILVFVGSRIRKKRKLRKMKSKRGVARSKKVRKLNSKMKRGMDLTYPEKLFIWEYSNPKNNPKGKVYNWVKPIKNKPKI